jgi:TolA-binding protein
MLLDSEGKERVRLEGYLTNQDFNAALASGLGRIAFVKKKYADAERWYGDVVSLYGNSHSGPGAMYWKAVSHYKATNDHTVLGQVAEELKQKFPKSVWAEKAIPWLH